MAQWKRVSFTSANAQTPARALECGASRERGEGRGIKTLLDYYFLSLLAKGSVGEEVTRLARRGDVASYFFRRLQSCEV